MHTRSRFQDFRKFLSTQFFFDEVHCHAWYGNRSFTCYRNRRSYYDIIQYMWIGLHRNCTQIHSTLLSYFHCFGLIAQILKFDSSSRCCNFQREHSVDIGYRTFSRTFYGNRCPDKRLITFRIYNLAFQCSLSYCSGCTKNYKHRKQ